MITPHITLKLKLTTCYSEDTVSIKCHQSKNYQVQINGNIYRESDLHKFI